MATSRIAGVWKLRLFPAGPCNGGFRMDFLIKLFRSLSHTMRLRIIQFVISHPEATLSEIADALGMSKSEASRHVSLLASVGAIESRPSGRFLLVNAADPRSSEHSVLRKVRRLLTKYLDEGSLREASDALRLGAGKQNWNALLAAMCFEFTAYTNLRRLLLLRLLSEQGPMDSAAVMQKIGLSQAAMRRHVDKLLRRGILSETTPGRRSQYSIVNRPEAPFRRELLAVMRAHLAQIQ